MDRTTFFAAFIIDLQIGVLLCRLC